MPERYNECAELINQLIAIIFECIKDEEITNIINLYSTPQDGGALYPRFNLTKFHNERLNRVNYSATR
jgi:hypothetical protein